MLLSFVASNYEDRGRHWVSISGPADCVALVESWGVSERRLTPHRGHRWCMPVRPKALELLKMVRLILSLRRLLSFLLARWVVRGRAGVSSHLWLLEAVSEETIVPHEGVPQTRLGRC